LLYSYETKEKQTIFSGLRSALRNNNVEVDDDVEIEDSSRYPYKRQKDDSKDEDDETQPLSKKPHLSARRNTECTMSAVLQRRTDLHRSSNTCSAVSRSVECDVRTRSHVFHRPFETAPLVGRCEADTGTDGQSSPEAGSCQTADDVVSWADCLRQLATALRRRKVADNSGCPAEAAIPADVRRLDQGKTADDRRSRDCKRRDGHYDCDSDMEHDDPSRSIDNDDYSPTTTISSNLSVSNFDTTTTTEYTRSVDDFRCPLSSNAAVQSHPHPCRGLNALTSNLL